MLTGMELIRDIDQCHVPPRQLAIWWLGQHSFVVKAGATVIYFDPFLSPLPRRLVAPLLEAWQVQNATIICGSHDHTDHIDRDVWPGIAKASPIAKFVVPNLLRNGLSKDLSIPEEKFVGLNDGKTVQIGDVRIHGIAAAHEFFDQDPATEQYPYLGYVIEANDCEIYHSGDCCIYEGLQTKLKKYDLDVVFLPINGRDAERLVSGCLGNMTYQEAADLAGALRPGLTIPAHYEMFANNSQDPQPFIAYMDVKYPYQRTVLLEHGKRFVYRR